MEQQTQLSLLEKMAAEKMSAQKGQMDKMAQEISGLKNLLKQKRAKSPRRHDKTKGDKDDEPPLKKTRLQKGGAKSGTAPTSEKRFLCRDWFKGECPGPLDSKGFCLAAGGEGKRREHKCRDLAQAKWFNEAFKCGLSETQLESLETE